MDLSILLQYLNFPNRRIPLYCVLILGHFVRCIPLYLLYGLVIFAQFFLLTLYCVMLLNLNVSHILYFVS